MRGIVQPLLVQRGDEFRNPDAYRAGLDAAGLLAVQAARGLEQGLFVVVSVADLLEVGRAELRFLFTYRDARYSVLPWLFVQSDSTYVSGSPFGLDRRTALLLRAIHALAAHRLVEIDLVPVELGALDAREAGLAAHCHAAGAAHARSVHHQGVERDGGLQRKRFVVRATNFIMIIGPMATHSS